MIVWGTKEVKKNLGFVAEFCPICREIEQFKVTRLCHANHIYFISLGSGQIVGFPSRCQSCGLTLNLDAVSYPELSKRGYPNIQAAIRESHPDILDKYAVRLELEEKIKRKQVLSTEERTTLLNEPFQLYANFIEARYSKGTPLDRESGLGCLATILVPASLLFLPLFLLNDALMENVFIPAAWVGGSICLSLSFYFFITVHKRYIKREVLPMLAKSLKSLNPTPSELEEIISRYKTAGLKLGKTLKAQQILDEIQSNATFGKSF